MRSAALLVIMLLSMQVKGAVDKTTGPVGGGNQRPEETKGTTNTPANDSDPPFLGNLLVIPMDGSHWVDLKALAQEMGRRGHRVTVVIPEVSIRMGPGKYYDTVTFPVPYDKAVIDSIMVANKDVMEKSTVSFMEKIQKRFTQFQKIKGFLHSTAESLLFNASIISQLEQQEIHYDDRIDMTLELPRPLMPNTILVGGINCNVRDALPEDLLPWVSGEHGFIVFTLGTVVSEMPEETTTIFLEAFRQIPQKVIWRYTGQIDGNLPDNVKIMKWVPQNDLLAHPGARAFITHAGSHGLYEGLCHAVPMVMVPLSAEQPGQRGEDGK
ncbi:hypothetical protein fugu_014298 [Takifugu bimaculatus]|uniref:UDP-glucuronosyltransferase n=1 Tax=Takifugu bimaculatus TaxID=433685 RepID=A0A4Z2C1D3_9TELE|nr:hypothetical protein fugu_014298 [Takifugu bimaculatus]